MVGSPLPGGSWGQPVRDPQRLAGPEEDYSSSGRPGYEPTLSGPQDPPNPDPQTSFRPRHLVRTLTDQPSHSSPCTNLLLFEVRHGVVDLDRGPLVNAHLLHHAVEEVFSLLVRAGGENAVEVVEVISA